MAKSWRPLFSFIFILFFLFLTFWRFSDFFRFPACRNVPRFASVWSLQQPEKVIIFCWLEYLKNEINYCWTWESPHPCTWFVTESWLSPLSYVGAFEWAWVDKKFFRNLWSTTTVDQMQSLRCSAICCSLLLHPHYSDYKRTWLTRRQLDQTCHWSRVWVSINARLEMLQKEWKLVVHAPLLNLSAKEVHPLRQCK